MGTDPVPGFRRSSGEFPLEPAAALSQSEQLMKTLRWWNSTEAKNSTEQLNSVEAREGKQLAL